MLTPIRLIRDIRSVSFFWVFLAIYLFIYLNHSTANGAKDIRKFKKKYDFFGGSADRNLWIYSPICIEMDILKSSGEVVNKQKTSLTCTYCVALVNKRCAGDEDLLLVRAHSAWTRYLLDVLRRSLW